MRTADLREVVYNQPFRPFHLVMADGTRIPVASSEFIICPPTARMVSVYAKDRYRWLDVALILGVELEDVESPEFISKSERRGRERPEKEVDDDD